MSDYLRQLLDGHAPLIIPGVNDIAYPPEFFPKFEAEVRRLAGVSLDTLIEEHREGCRRFAESLRGTDAERREYQKQLEKAMLAALGVKLAAVAWRHANGGEDGATEAND
jgi:hypothetical protein